MSALHLGLLLLVSAVVASSPWWWLRAATQAAPTRRRGPLPEPVDDAVVLDLLRAALATGLSIVDALSAIGEVLPEPQGQVYARAAAALRWGASWSDAVPDSVVSRALGPAHNDGVDPTPMLLHGAAHLRRARRAASREASARLGVRLVLPLGLCLLPAFILLGLVPVLISAGMSLWGH